MDAQYPRSPWYDQSLPNAPDEGGAAAAAPKQRKNRTGMKITAIVLCVAILIAASAVAFSDRAVPFWKKPLPETTAGPDALPPSSGEAGAAESPRDERPSDSGSFADDFKEFFSSFYTSVEQPLPDSRIQKADIQSDFRLTLQSAADRKEMTLRELYPACVDTVVSIRAKSYKEFGVIHSGTGFIVSDNGFIITNQHVLSDTDVVSVVLSDGSEYDGYLVGEDASTDIAVLKIAAKDLPVAELGESDRVMVGDAVAAIGNPLGEDLTGTLTSGIISAIDRDINYNGHSLSLLQTTAALNEGNSGGPLFNMYGQVIGITNMKLSNAYSDVTIEGIGFAIPTATVKAVADQLIATGKYSRPALGITVGPVPAEAAEHYDLPEGLYISAIAEGSSAEEEGVQVGDILTHVNGTPVRKTTDVLEIRDTLAVGDKMTLTIFREGKTFDIVITLRELSELYTSRG